MSPFRLPYPLLFGFLTASMHPGPATGAPAHVLFDLSSPETCPFPSDAFTVPDASQLTGLRVKLPAASSASENADVDLLNTLDGFNLQPRLSIEFDEPIDITSANDSSIFLVPLTFPPGGNVLPGPKVGTDQVVSDKSVKSLYVESDEPLQQHSRYILIVTNKLLDQDGHHIKASVAFHNFVENGPALPDPVLESYRAALRGALGALDQTHVVPLGNVVAASLFTTLSATASLENIRVAIHSGAQPTADFNICTDNTRAVFALNTVTQLQLLKETDLQSAQLTPNPSQVQALAIVPQAIGTIAFGRFMSPEFRTGPGLFIPTLGSAEVPVTPPAKPITFVLFLPPLPKPAGGYPVVIYGHGGNLQKGTSGFVAAELANYGFATIAIDAPGAGYGEKSEYRIKFSDATTKTVKSGGRGIDQNGDHMIGDSEGLDPNPTSPLAVLGKRRADGFQQWTADHMQLVRLLKGGLDVDGNGLNDDLSVDHIYYVGTSGGGREGVLLLAVEPDIRAGVLNVPNATMDERLSTVRGNFPAGLQSRTPPLINSPGIQTVDGVTMPAPRFDENLPLKSPGSYDVVLDNTATRTVKSPVTNDVDGALAIQQAMERAEWASQCGSSMAFVPHLRRSPLKNVPAKAVIIQFAYGDQRIPNPSTTALLKAGDLIDRATVFRFDHAKTTYSDIPPNPPNFYPHTFLQLFPKASNIWDPNYPANVIALQAQTQIAKFFKRDMSPGPLDPFDANQIDDPDDAGTVFEKLNAASPLPTGLNYK